MWSMAQRPQTTAEALRSSTSVEINRPQTAPSTQRPITTLEMNRPTTQTGAAYAQTSVKINRPQTLPDASRLMTDVEVVHPATTVEVIHPQTTVEVLHPQTPGFLADTSVENTAASPAKRGSKSLTTAQAATSMSNFKPKQAKDFAAQPKAAPIGGGENKLGNETNVAEKDAANKASLLGKQSNQNMDVNPKQTNLGGLGKAVEQKVEEKKK